MRYQQVAERLGKDYIMGTRTVQVSIPRITSEDKALMEENLPGVLFVSDIPYIETERDAVKIAKPKVRVARNEHLSVKHEVKETDAGWTVTFFVLTA